MIAGVGLRTRLPDDLFAVDRLAVNHRRNLAVGCAQVKADPAAVQVAAQRPAAFGGGRHFVRRAYHDGEGVLVNFLAHKVIVKLPRARRRIDLLNVLSDVGRPAHIDLPAAALPEQKLHKALGILQVGFGVGMPIWKDGGLKAGQSATFALNSQH